MSLEAETRRAAAYQALGFLRGLLTRERDIDPESDFYKQVIRIVELADKEQE